MSPVHSANQASVHTCRPGRAQRLHVCAAIKKDTAKHVVCSKTLIGKPDQVKRLQRKCQDILDFSLGKAQNKENGILEFTCSQDSYATNVFHFWERYDGNTSLGRHNTSPEYMKFMEGVRRFAAPLHALPCLCMLDYLYKSIEYKWHSACLISNRKLEWHNPQSADSVVLLYLCNLIPAVHTLELVQAGRPSNPL